MCRFYLNMKIKKDLIIVCMSPNPDLRQKAEEFGVDYFVSKVDSPNKLLRVFRDCEDRIESSSSLNAT